MLTFTEILSIVDGQSNYCGRDFKIKQVGIDSRQCSSGEAFIAIKGDAFDGHKFIGKAVAAGAKLVVASRPIKGCSVPVIRVKDTVKALGQIATYHRQRFDIPVIAITGSVGKTTTKDFIHSVLRSSLHCLANTKSFNNHIGVPLTLLRLTKKHQVAVLEVGTNQKGDIAYLAEMIQPTMAVFTAFGESHLEGLKDRNGVAREKLALCKFLKPKGAVIYNADDLFLSRKIKALKGFKKIACGVEAKAAVQAQNVCNSLKNKVLFTYRKKRYAIKGIALHNVTSAIIAICCGELFNIRYNTINNSLIKAKLPAGRMHLVKANKRVIINDTYNANPMSTKAAIDSLCALPVKGRRIIVLGDMAELGQKAKALHLDIAKYLQGYPSIAQVLTFGSLSFHVSQYLDKHKTFPVKHFRKMPLLINFLKQNLVSNDVVLVKGSRSMQMERVIEGLVK